MKKQVIAVKTTKSTPTMSVKYLKPTLSTSRVEFISTVPVRVSAEVILPYASCST